MIIYKILIWLSFYFILYILFSVNTLISIFCFIIVVFITCIFLIKLHIEYLTFLVLLLYLGGILIFFLFTSLMLQNEYNIKKTKNSYSFENILLLIFFCKIFYMINIVNCNLSFFKHTSLFQYFINNINNNIFFFDLISNYNDIYSIIGLYSEKWIFLVLLGMILLFTMIGVIVITKTKNV